MTLILLVLIYFKDLLIQLVPVMPGNVYGGYVNEKAWSNPII